MSILDRESALINSLAVDLGCDAQCLRAILRVECPGEGLINGRPVIRMEVHHLWSGVPSTQHAAVDALFHVAGPRAQDGHQWRPAPTAAWMPLHQPGPSGQALEWQALNLARGINRVVADESTSWGAGQVLGSNWRALGFANIDHFVDSQLSDGGQLRTFSQFLSVHHLGPALQARDWNTVARVYNGAGAMLEYAARLAGAYAKG